MRTTGHLTLSLLMLLLGGCAALAKHEAMSAGWQAHSQQLAALQHWTARGKLAVFTVDTAESASMKWQQQDQRSHLELSGPLGVGATTISSDGQQLDILQGDEQRTLDISTPDAILLNTGWDLPLVALTHWLKGLPSPSAKVDKLELDPATELLLNLHQDNWEISYQAYGQFQGYTLPTRILITRGTTRVKVVIAQWQTSPD